jgi:hypothetical protein
VKKNHNILKAKATLNPNERKMEVANFDLHFGRDFFMPDAVPIPVERIEKAILLIRGQKVMLDRDLAGLYGVPTRC